MAHSNLSEKAAAEKSMKTTQKAEGWIKHDIA